MKRFKFTIVLFLLIGLTYSCDENTTKKNDLTLMGFHGNIETIVETEYNLSTKFGEEQIGDMSRKIITKFNNDGNVIEQNRYDSHGALMVKWKYTYDENGNMIERNMYDSDVESEVKWKCTYDENDNIIEKREYEVDGVLEEPIMLIKYEIIYR
jgi:YD repeat-containing protein